MQKGLKRIILHWTAGQNRPNDLELSHYHYLVDVRGFIHNGKLAPEANIDCKDGEYCAHTGGGNTGSIGVALCGMYGFSYPSLYTPFPLSKLQLEAAFSLIARLCKKYEIPVLKDTVLTHYEFGLQNPSTTSKGKIDICYLPPYPEVHKYQVGNFIRTKVKWYLAKI